MFLFHLSKALPFYHNCLNLNLRILIPCVENSLSEKSFRPGDILISRSGMGIEIKNTDAEGRLILADALTYSTEKNQIFW